MPKGSAAKALAKRNHATSGNPTQRQAVMEIAMGLPGAGGISGLTSAHTALTHAPLTPLQVNAQKRRAQHKSKQTSKQRCAKINAAYQAASVPRGAVTRRHKMVICPSGANNNRKCNTNSGIRC